MKKILNVRGGGWAGGSLSSQALLVTWKLSAQPATLAPVYHEDLYLLAYWWVTIHGVSPLKEPLTLWDNLLPGGGQLRHFVGNEQQNTNHFLLI